MQTAGCRHSSKEAEKDDELIAKLILAPQDDAASARHLLRIMLLNEATQVNSAWPSMCGEAMAMAIAREEETASSALQWALLPRLLSY